jgi:hypothetical protein
LHFDWPDASTHSADEVPKAAATFG